jgi:uncharacterized MAPEG superfamily protein
VNVTTELNCLTLISTATALMWVPYVAARMTTYGVMRAIGVPGPDYPTDAPWVDRARRAHINAVENLVVFAPLVIVAAIVGVSTKATVLSAQIYVAARLAHYVIYAFGIPVIRTFAFLAGSIATLVIAMEVLLRAP